MRFLRRKGSVRSDGPVFRGCELSCGLALAFWVKINRLNTTEEVFDVFAITQLAE